MPIALKRFARDEDGGMIVFTLFILICMLLAVGVAIDTVRTEFTRIHLQNVTDSAVLAAADLDQTLDPKSVVDDWVERAGFEEGAVTVEVLENSLDARSIQATARREVSTMFIDMIGIDTLSAPASSVAEEAVTEIEIALVLDNSGSMANNNNYRLNLLKPAAQSFVTQVLNNEAAEGKVAISIIPFATQVNAGPDLLKHYNVSDEHGYSNCVTFEDENFSSAALSTGTALNRTAHFDPNQTRLPPQDKYRVCRTDSSREITPWSDNETDLYTQIDNMVGFGWTSIEIGAKWGATLLDPASRPVLSAMIDEGLVDEKFEGQPFDYGVSGDDGITRIKYLIVMSDGANTSQWDIDDPYREGPSPVFVFTDDTGRYGEEGKSYYSYYYTGDDVSSRPADKPYYRFTNFNGEGSGAWFEHPAGHDPAFPDQTITQLTWPQVWEAMSVKYYTKNLYNVALGKDADDEYGRIVNSISSSKKNTRTSTVCQAAKDAGVIVYTIGMDTYGQGDATLADCSSGADRYFYDVESEDLDQAFSSIARSINQLRLTN